MTKLPEEAAFSPQSVTSGFAEAPVNMTDQVTVTQEDRELAYSLLFFAAKTELEKRAIEYIRDGKGDDARAVQEISAHRQAAEQRGAERERERCPDEDWFEEVIDDSLEMDWKPRDAAKWIVARWEERWYSEDVPPATVQSVAAMSACRKCGLKAETLMHPFCTHEVCPVRQAIRQGEQA